MREFKATHVIEIQREGKPLEQIPVMVCEKVAYTQLEWDRELPADWELDEDGALCFQGQTPIGRYRFLAVEDKSRK